MAERFELEVVTIFQEQGLEAAVQRMQQQLRSISAAAAAPAAGGGVPDITPQIQQLTIAQRALEQAAQRSGTYTTSEINNARALLQAEANALTAASATFQQALSASQQRGAVLLQPRPTLPGGAQVRSEGSVNGGLGNVRGSAEAISTQARELEESRGEGELAAASAQLSRVRRQLAADIVQLQVADRDYVEATGRLADARSELAALAYQQRSVGTAAEQNVQGRLFGAQVRTEASNRLAENPESVDVLAGELNARTRLQAALREAADAEGELTATTARLRQTRVNLTEGVQRSLAADDEYLESTVRLAISRDRLATSELRASGSNTAAVTAAIDRAVEQRLHTTVRSVGVNEAILRNDMLLNAEVERAMSATARSAAVREEVARRESAAAGGLPLLGGGTRFQRLQANFAGRSGQGPVDPARFQTLNQYVGTRLATTAAYGASGAVLYGGVNALQSMVEETAKLDERFRLMQNQFEASDRAAEFPQFRRSIMEIARETGVTADVVADVGFQLAGAFESADEALQNTRASMMLVQISGLEVEDVTNDLTAATATWGMTAQEIGDTLASVERRYGVELNQSLDIMGQMSNTAAQAGLTFEEMSEIIGGVARVSGRSSTAIAESFNRILPSIATNANQINEIYAQALEGGNIDQGQMDEMMRSLAAGESGQALMQILREWDELQGQQQDRLIQVLGGQRESQTVIPLLQSRERILTGVARGAGADTGALQTRFEHQQAALQTQLERLGETFRQLGVQLGEAGLLDTLQLLAGGLLVVVTAAARFLEVFNWIDDHLGNAPSRVIALVVAIRLLQLALRGFRGIRNDMGNVFTGGMFRRGVAQDVTQDAAEASARRATAVSTQTAATTVAGQGVRDQWRNRPRTERVFEAGPSGIRETRRIAQASTEATAAATAAAQSGRTMGQRIGQSFVSTTTNVTTALNNAWLRARTRIQTLGNWTATTQLPGPGVRPGQQPGRLGQVGMFMTGGQGGLAGGVAAAGAGVMAGSSLLTLAEVSQSQQQSLAEQQRRIRDQLTGRSVQELQALRRSAAGRDNWATRMGSWVGLNATVGETVNQAIDRQTVREFELAVEEGFIGQDPEMEKLLNELRENQGRGEAGRRGRARLEQLQQEQRDEINTLRQRGHVGEMSRQTKGDTDVEGLAVDAARFDIGQLRWDEYTAKMRETVERLRRQAEGGDPQAIANYQRALQQYTQALSSNVKARVQLMQSAAGAATTPEQTAAILNQASAEVDRGALAWRNLNSVPTPGPGGQPVVPQGPPVTQASGQARLDQLMELRQQRQQAFEQATANVTDPARIEELRGIFQMTPEQMAEIQALQQFLFQQIFDMGGIVTQAGQLEQAAQNLFSLQQAQAQADIAGMTNPAAIAARQQQLAAQQRTAAEAIVDPDQRRVALENARAAQSQAVRQVQDTGDRVAQARLQLAGQRVGRDPVAAAQNQIAQGRLALRQARGDEAAALAARAQIEAGQQALEEAQADVGRAQIALFRAQRPEDAIAQAQAAQREADLAARNAHGAAARLSAEAQRIQADREMQEALRDVYNAQSELLEAQFNASGELVGAAQEGLNRARRALDDARGRDVGREVLDRLEAEVVNQQNSVRQRTNSDMQEMIDFDLQMGTIGTEAAIARYRAMLPLLNPREQREMLLRIRQLEQQAAGGVEGLQFNLPTTLGLPTLYTARRMAQETMGDGRMYTSGAGVTTTNYDNRNVTITLNTDAAFDGQAAVQTIVNALNEAPRYGTQPRLY